jgi:glycosyltransferase involved in cell wall biosynthesis
MVSIVVPVFNEKESLVAFYQELKKSLLDLKRDYEIIFVDDGSTDDSLMVLQKLADKDKKIRIFSFRRNLGKAEALTLGFQKAAGDTIVTLDADLQDQPSEIAKLLAKQEKENVDIVSGWRKDRKDKSKMVIISRIFNFVMGKLFGVYLHDYNCGLKVYTKEAAKSMRLYGGLHRFIPLLAFQQGFSIDELPVHHEPRKFGKSKYGFTKIKDLPDIFTMLFLAKYSKRPLHFFGPVGGSVLLLGAILFGYLTILWLSGESIGRRPLFFTSIFLMLGGLQIFFTGFLAELLISITSKQSVHFPLKYSTDQ